MDLAKTLIGCVTRAFHETKHILVIDALIVHSALRDDDLAHLLGMQTKELRKLCAYLEEIRLLAVHNRPELREGATRPILRTYYFIDYRSTIDAIKYRMYRIGKTIESLIRPTEERKDYRCPRCKSSWTQLEVLDHYGAQGFLCHKCDYLLVRDSDGDAAMGGKGGGHEKQSLLNQQLRSMLDLLPQIDDVFIPESTFELALNVAVPVVRNAATNPLIKSVPVAPDGKALNGMMTVKGMTQASAVTNLEVQLTSSDEKTAGEQAVLEEKRAKLAKQNALPDWIVRSTITGESTGKVGSVADTGTPLLGVKVEDKKEEVKKIGKDELSDEVAGYYRIMAAERAQAERDAAVDGIEEDDEEDEEDEEDFEDVPTNVATPETIPTFPMERKPTPTTANLKRSFNDSDESGKNTEATNTPLTISTPEYESSKPKKAKLATPLSPPSSSETTTTHVKARPSGKTKSEAEGKDSEEGEDGGNNDDDDDENVDFEDVTV